MNSGGGLEKDRIRELSAELAAARRREMTLRSRLRLRQAEIRALQRTLERQVERYRHAHAEKENELEAAQERIGELNRALDIFHRKVEYVYSGKAIRDAQEREKNLREALEGYHALAPRIAEYLNDIGAALAYSDFYRANQKADAALASDVKGE